ncbi:hypothetical protein KIH74_22795 [Kineosporia sp. J2-2]|uniref:Uncharacterized protein n=1 Tax=Kineosporia corallincola TaxID=2835133 RepID=A0ABS5TL14_9ACTN|nr:hypothetical protein [Kineosporia corallincola]MBT0771787.1 hypothetical protein [Kineosporia corallincola]
MDQPKTWRDTGRFLTPAELAALNDDQAARYFAASTVRSLDELDHMPEPHQAAFKGLLQRLNDRGQQSAAS